MGHIIGQKMLERNNKAIKMGSGERARHREGGGKQRKRETDRHREITVSVRYLSPSSSFQYERKLHQLKKWETPSSLLCSKCDNYNVWSNIFFFSRVSLQSNAVASYKVPLCVCQVKQRKKVIFKHFFSLLMKQLNCVIEVQEKLFFVLTF